MRLDKFRLEALPNTGEEFFQELGACSDHLIRIELSQDYSFLGWYYLLWEKAQEGKQTKEADIRYSLFNQSLPYLGYVTLAEPNPACDKKAHNLGSIAFRTLTWFQLAGNTLTKTITASHISLWTRGSFSPKAPSTNGDSLGRFCSTSSESRSHEWMNDECRAIVFAYWVISRWVSE